MEKLNRHKFLLSALVILFMATLWPAASPAQEITKLRYFTGMTATHYYCKEMIPFFTKEVEKRTNGRVKFEVYPGGELYGYLDGIDATVAGTADIGLTSIGHWGGYNKVFLCTDFFLLIEDNDHWFRARDTISPILSALYGKQNIKVLHYLAYSENSIGSRVRIETLEDMKGLKIRAPVPGALDSIKGWGAVPTRIAAAEMYDALSKGAIDAIVTAWGSHYARKLHEVEKYFVGPIWTTTWVAFMNLKKWNGLSKDIQEAIQAVSREAENRSLQLTKSYDEKYISAIKNAGGVIKILTREEKKQWGKPLQKVYDKWVKDCAAAGWEKEAKQIMEALVGAR